MDGSAAIKPLLTLKEVAATLKVSLSTVRRAVRSGALESVHAGDRQIRVSSRSLAKYLGQSLDSVPLRTEQPCLEVEDVPSVQSCCSSFDRGQTAEQLRWRVLHGDARTCATQLEAGSVDCIVTSPPYYWQRDYEVDGQIGHESTIEAYVEALVRLFDALKPALADDGLLFLNLGDTYYSAKGKPHGRDDKHNGRQMMRKHLRAVDGPGLGLPRKSMIGIPWRVALGLQSQGWTLRSSIIWQRPGTLPEPTAHDRPWRTYENIFMFSKSPKYYFSRSALLGEEDIWKIVARPENPGSHFAPYPRELVHRCLAVGCKPNGVVLDPFVGSGTTMLAALQTGRHAIGIELNQKYCEFLVTRIDKEFGSLDG
jgi:excisionase family DNA binding protein